MKPSCGSFSKLANDDSFRSAVEANPREALKGYVVDVEDIPIDTAVELPSKEQVEQQLEGAVAEGWRMDPFVGHWPVIWRC